MRTLATFRSESFNVSAPKDYFVNPGCYGDDLAKWLIARLRQAGLQTDGEPGQEDFGWYFEFTAPEGVHCCVLGYRPPDGDEPGVWILWLERSRGLMGSLFGGRNRGIAQSAIAAIHTTLSGAPEVTHLRWHLKADFDAGREDSATEAP